MNDIADTSDTSVKYTIRLFDLVKSSRKIYIGQKDAPKRCRFCGKVMDSSHFSKEAYTISISLENTKFICADECNECNEQFGNRLENDITNFFSFSSRSTRFLRGMGRSGRSPLGILKCR